MMDLKTLNAFITLKIRLGIAKDIEEVITLFKLTSIFDREEIYQSRHENLRRIQKGHAQWKGQVYEIDEFGHVFITVDGEKSRLPTPMMMYNGRKQPCLRRMSDGKPKLINVARLMLVAMKDAKEPRAVKFIDDHPNYPLWLGNIDFKETKERQVAPNKMMLTFKFESQEELDGLMWTHKLETLTDLAQHLHIPTHEVNLNGFKCHRVDEMPKVAEYSSIFEIHGRKVRVNRFGGVQTIKGDIWDNYWEPFLTRGQIKVSMAVNGGPCHGQTRVVNVGKLMATAFDGVVGRTTIRQIDGNPYNLVYRNQWWNDCGRRRYFQE